MSAKDLFVDVGEIRFGIVRIPAGTGLPDLLDSQTGPTADLTTTTAVKVIFAEKVFRTW